MDYQKLAQMLFPNQRLTPEEVRDRYPKRDLAQGAAVTRLAPSPTGYIHLGNLYGAFVDERLAHQSGGVCYLRIEDTDQKRLVEGSIEMIIDGLAYYGIHFDEGVTAHGETGAYGPYHQSERADIYQSFAKLLVEKGLAYPSFQTEEELAALREKQEALKLTPGYYGQWATDRNLTLEEIEAKLEAGTEWVLRLKSSGDPEEVLYIPDGIRGEIRVRPNNQDIVLIKTNGLPTYHFAHVIDDHFMGTTHVVRGEEWLSTLNIHLELFEVLGWDHPVYCHTAHLMKMDGETRRKLSKRLDPELRLSYYQEVGYFPTAVRAYLMTLMNSDYEEFRLANPEASVEDFRFELSKMPNSGALFDLMKLDDISKDILLNFSAEEIYDFFLNWAKDHKPEALALIQRDREVVIRLLDIGRDGNKPRKDLVHCSQIWDHIDYAFEETFVQKDGLPERVDAEEARAILEAYVETYDGSDDSSSWFGKVKEIAEARGYAVKMKDFKKNPENYKGNVADVSAVIRLALTGRQNAPDLWTIQQILGQEETLRRMKAYAPLEG